MKIDKETKDNVVEAYKQIVWFRIKIVSVILVLALVAIFVIEYLDK